MTVLSLSGRILCLLFSRSELFFEVSFPFFIEQVFLLEFFFL